MSVWEFAKVRTSNGSPKILPGLPRSNQPESPAHPAAEPNAPAPETTDASSDLIDSVLEWDCDPGLVPSELLLRSVVIDVCRERKQFPGDLPQEFVCDLHDDQARFLLNPDHKPSTEGDQESSTSNRQSENIASPPLSWRIANATNVASFTLLFENTKTHAVHWLVQEIPESVRSLVVGASQSRHMLPAIETANSFGVRGYTSPCPSLDESNEFRFILFAMPAATPPSSPQPQEVQSDHTDPSANPTTPPPPLEIADENVWERLIRNSLWRAVLDINVSQE